MRVGVPFLRFPTAISVGSVSIRRTRNDRNPGVHRHQARWGIYPNSNFFLKFLPNHITKHPNCDFFFQIRFQSTNHIVAWTYRFSSSEQRRGAALCLRRLAALTTYNWVKFEMICPEVIAMCSDILEPSSVKVLRITTFDLNNMEVEE